MLSLAKTAPNDLYFAICEDTARLKIGRSSDVDRRLRQLQSASPTPLRMVKVERAGFIEPILHRQFAHLRLHNEWFEADTSLVGLANKLLRGPTVAVPPEVFGSWLENFYVVGVGFEARVVPFDDLTVEDVSCLALIAKQEAKKAQRRANSTEMVVEYIRHHYPSPPDTLLASLFATENSERDQTE